MDVWPEVRRSTSSEKGVPMAATALEPIGLGLERLEAMAEAGYY